jgi:hypothetical protein
MTPLFLFYAFRHTVPSLRLFVPNSLTVDHRFFSSEGCSCNVFFLLVFAVITLQPQPLFPPYVRSSQATPDKVLLILSIVVGAGASTSPAPPLCSVFFFFGGGQHLQKAQSLILSNPLEIPNSRFTNSSPNAFPSISSDVLSSLRRSCHLIRELFIRSLPRSCCFRLRSLTPLLHSGPFQPLIPDVRTFGVLGATLSWSYVLRSCILRSATFALCIISLRATANSYRGSQLA